MATRLQKALADIQKTEGTDDEDAGLEAICGGFATVDADGCMALTSNGATELARLEWE